jgi:hypothetical protein
MDSFSYLSVLLSIIIGLGMTQVLTAMGRLVRHRAHVRFYWPSLLWALTVLAIYVQMWWSAFGLRGHQDWTFASFSLVLLEPMCFYLLAAVVLPEEIEAGGVDLRAHYYEQHQWLFGFLLATVIVSVLKEEALEHRLPQGANFGFHIYLIALSVTGIVVRRPRYHEILAVLAAISVAAYIAILFATLQ